VPDNPQGHSVVLPRLVEVLWIGEGRAADRIREVYIVTNERDPEIVMAEATQYGVEVVVPLMDAMVKSPLRAASSQASLVYD
jgi:hypothetical protein